MKKFTWIFELLIQFLLCEKNLLKFSNYSSNFSFAKKIYLNFWIIQLIFPLQKKFTRIIHLIFILWKKFTWIFLIWLNYSFKKKISNYYFRKNVQLLIRILFCEKFIQYTLKKNLSKFYFTKKYSDYSLVLWCYVLYKIFY